MADGSEMLGSFEFHMRDIGYPLDNRLDNQSGETD